MLNRVFLMNFFSICLSKSPMTILQDLFRVIKVATGPAETLTSHNEKLYKALVLFHVSEYLCLVEMKRRDVNGKITFLLCLRI